MCQREGPGAGIPPAGICEGGAGQPASLPRQSGIVRVKTPWARGRGRALGMGGHLFASRKNPRPGARDVGLRRHRFGSGSRGSFGLGAYRPFFCEDARAKFWVRSGSSVIVENAMKSRTGGLEWCGGNKATGGVALVL